MILQILKAYYKKADAELSTNLKSQLMRISPPRELYKNFRGT